MNDDLLATAREVRARAYVPYSSFPVGAAGRVDDGRVVVGCNVENASYGLSLCAECAMVTAMISGGSGKLTEVVCVGPDDEAVAPCGRCRQILSEHATAGCTVNDRPLTELIPDAFGPTDLP